MDYDGHSVENTKPDNARTYKQTEGYYPVICSVNKLPVYMQNRNGNTDSAYVGEDLDKQLREQKKVIPQIIEKGFKNKPLTEQQITSNNEKSKTRVRVEHIFGFVENSMNGSYIRSIGMTRAKGIIGLMNLTYNLFRKIQIA